MSRSRAWFITQNNYGSREVEVMNDLAREARYAIACKELAPTTGMKHIHMFVYFDNQRDFASLKRRLPTANLQLKKGTDMQASEYIKKGGKYRERGKLPEQGRASWERIEEAMDNPCDNMQLFTQYRKAFREALTAMTPRDKPRKVIVCLLADKLHIMQKIREREIQPVFLETLADYDINDKAVFVDDYIEGNRLFEYVKEWYNGFPRRVHRGYERVPFDPDIVCVVSRDLTSLHHNISKYRPYIDRELWRFVHDEDFDPDEDQLGEDSDHQDNVE